MWGGPDHQECRTPTSERMTIHTLVGDRISIRTLANGHYKQVLRKGKNGYSLSSKFTKVRSPASVRIIISTPASV